MFNFDKKYILIFSFLFLNSCLSSLLKEPAPTFSDEIQLPAVISEFTQQKTSTYPSWKNKKTSNVISVISECSDVNLTLKSAHAMITNAVESETVLEEKKSKHKDLPAYFRKISGQIDGHDLEIQSLSFKYKNCFYVSSISGSKEKIAQDVNTWTTFNQSIEFKK
jgi:hypothetical protein